MAAEKAAFLAEPAEEDHQQCIAFGYWALCIEWVEDAGMPHRCRSQYGLFIAVGRLDGISVIGKDPRDVSQSAPQLEYTLILSEMVLDGSGEMAMEIRPRGCPHVPIDAFPVPPHGYLGMQMIRSFSPVSMLLMHSLRE